MIAKITEIAKIGKVLLLVIAVLPGVFGSAVAESSPISIEQLYRHQTMYSDGKLLQFTQNDRQEIAPAITEKGQKQKSVAMAAGLSLLVPGAGQFYVGEKVRAAPFFLADIGGWVTYFGFRSQGKRRERDYQAFADMHWDTSRYFAFLDTALGISSRSDFDPVTRNYDSHDYFPDSVANLVIDTIKNPNFVFAHHIPAKEGGRLEKNFEYYENFGKYDQFFAGWDDYSTGVNRSTYRRMRAKANDSFSKSKIGIIVSMADRLVAAFDAALAAKRFNKKINKTNEIEIGFRMTRYNGARMPKLLATYKF